MNDRGQKGDNAEQLKDLALDFYKELFTADLSAGGEFMKGCFPLLSAETK